MKNQINRREFLELTAAGCAMYLCRPVIPAYGADLSRKGLISPGCRKSKVKVARIYLANPSNPWSLWPKPDLDLKGEIRFYESEFAKLKDELRDVEFVADELVTSVGQVGAVKGKLNNVDGVLVIQLGMGITGILEEVLRLGHPTMVFAVPYSGHGWTSFGRMLKEPIGAKMGCMLTTDYNQLAVAIRPFRAIHHLREAKILNVTTGSFEEYADEVKSSFGTEIKRIELQRVLDAYDAVGDWQAKTETDRWIREAEVVVEPPREDIFKSCKLALAFEALLDEEEATVMTVDCYGTMWDKTIMLPAYPCLGFGRLNSMGLGGICESDLRSAMTHILFQGLVGKPGFISDPTVDESKDSIILAHCLGTPKMDGPYKPAAPYKLRTVMERREGVVTQVKMRIGQKVTQALLADTDRLLYFTGEIVDTPVGLEFDKGCRTKITVKVDGDIEKLWKNWSSGLHRQTCYGDITKELEYFCRFKEIEVVNEAV
jgi:hypothetical protein